MTKSQDNIMHDVKKETEGSCHHSTGVDWLLWICGSIVVFAGAIVLFNLSASERLFEFATAVVDIVSQMWWGVLIGIAFIGLLSRIPQPVIMGFLGTGTGFKGIWRATLAGVFLDLCSHGILMVGMKLYERGASLGQVMAFLIASPWNSLSLTLILWGLIGLPWTVTFLLLSMVIGIFSGLIFDKLVLKGTLPNNPYRVEKIDESMPQTLGSWWKSESITPSFFKQLFWEGLKGGRIVIRWMLFGVVIASAIRVFVSLDLFQTWLGPSVIGLLITMIAATIIEVCSEGTTPIAADILTRAKAPGNSFAFLMTGVSTDYTEIMVLKDTAKSWKIALFLPLVTVPQVVVLAIILNML